MSGTEQATTSTLDRLGESISPGTLWARRCGVALLALGILGGVLGFLGVTTREVSAESGGYELEVNYPRVARAGLDTPWQLRITKAGGLPDEVEVAITGEYTDIFESQGIWPEASEMTRDGERLLLTFTAPEGDTLVVDFDLYVQFSSQVGRDATVSVVEDGQDVVSVAYTTTLLP